VDRRWVMADVRSANRPMANIKDANEEERLQGIMK
jgi:hypothetical protein